MTSIVMSGGMGNPQGWNRYAYVAGDPVNYRDRRELEGEDVNDGDRDEVGCTIDGIPWPESFCDMYKNSEKGKPSGGGPAVPKSTAGSLLDRASDLLRDAFKNNPDCASLFNTSGMGPAALLDGMLDGQFGTIGFRDLRGTDTSTAQAFAMPREGSWSGYNPVGYMKVDIVINGRDDFASGVYWNGNSGGDVGRARILLHELGHVANLLVGGGGSLFRDTDSPPNKNWKDDQDFNQALELRCFP